MIIHRMALGILLFLAVLTSSVSAATLTDREDLRSYFQPFKQGTFVLYDQKRDAYDIFNEPASRQRHTPCSTFKIYNSLAALETRVLDPEDSKTLIKWNHKPSRYESWNQDQTLSSATKNSVVWYFQELASRIGRQNMQDFVNKIGYGNRDISGGLTTFWLSSSIQISAREQVDLLKKLFTGQLPVSPENVRIVKNNLTLLNENGTRLMGKTGSELKQDKKTLGWFVGYVEKQNSSYYFAVNIQAADGADGKKAKEIAMLILKDLKIL